MAKAKYKKLADGTFRTRIWDGTYNPDGSKHRVNLKSDKSSADLERQVRELKQKVETGDIVKPSGVMLTEYASEWLSVYKSVRARNTRHMYQNVIEKHFCALEGVRLQDARRVHLQMMINGAIDKPRTCQQIRLTWRQVIKSAIADGLLPEKVLRTSCDVELPKYRAKEKRPLTELEKKALKLADFTDMQRTFVYLIYGCGLRRSEAIALRPQDIVLERAELSVKGAIEFEGNNPYLKDPKSFNGYRTVPMPPFLVEHLEKYIPTLSSEWLMHTRDGGMMTKSSYDRMWSSIVYKMNYALTGSQKGPRPIHGLTAHIFRHNYCTALLYAGTLSTKKVAQLLGDNEDMVLKVYSHIMEEKENVPETVRNVIAL